MPILPENQVRNGRRGVPAKDWSHLSDLDLARTLFDYKDGALYWRYRKCNNIRIGDRAGRLKKNGYRDIRFRGRHIGEHRVIWLLVTGEWPSGELDHINGDPSDNRIENLRCVTRSENMQNTRRGSQTTGTTLLPNGRWQASIFVDGHRRHLGEHRTQQLAREAYLRAKARLHPAAVWS